MKLIITLLLNFCIVQVYSQIPYQVCKDEKHPEEYLLKGIINQSILQTDSVYNKWYAPSYNAYYPDSAILMAFTKAKAKIQFVIFGGTWCEDTQFILPKFFKLLKKSNYPDSVVSFFAVNRQKQSLSNIAQAFNLTNVPTIIVMSNGKEIGRVVEYGKTGYWDKELAEILNTLH